MTLEQLTFLVERSGIPTATLSVMAVFGLLLSPFPRFCIVLAALRIGLRGFPNSFLCIGLAFFLAYFQVAPLLTRIAAKGAELSPTGAAFSVAAEREFYGFVETEWRGYLEPRVSPQMKERITGVIGSGKTPADEWRIVSVAFFLSELQQAMKIALVLFLPLLVIDLLTGTALSAMGVESLSSESVSFPLKLALILSVGAWGLIGENLLRAYG